MRLTLMPATRGGTLAPLNKTYTKEILLARKRTQEKYKYICIKHPPSPSRI